MALYFQDSAQGPNVMAIILTSIPSRVWSYFSFGTIVVTDDRITQGPDRNSPEIAQGRAFMAEVYSLPVSEKPPWVGGTGKFRLARGFATFETLYLGKAILYSYGAMLL
ncbi:hypothetical protein Acr_00g0020120 [Actinidia rufa]|uniref:Dirigent protein n=1 Tax=Actinidia rufa TaxID=165716 RepID=A0A7J0DDA6_9ERIC|nr:hypothetical protein Acr_00g0020120 [Actinidia rufa]